MYVQLVTDYLLDDKVQQAGSEGRDLYVLFLLIAKQWHTGGIVRRGHLRYLPHEDPDPAAARLVELGLLEAMPGGWKIVAWAKYNATEEQIKAGNRKGGLRSGEVRRGNMEQRVAEHQDVPASNSPNEVERSRTKSREVEGSQVKSPEVPSVSDGGGGKATTPQTAAPAPARVDEPGNGSHPVDGDLPAYFPDDPTYAFDPQWRAEVELRRWGELMGTPFGKWGGGREIEAQRVLQQLHREKKLSVRQIAALIEHVWKDEFARGNWGTRKTPATWLEYRGAEQLWEKIRASADKAGVYGFRAAPKLKRDLGPKPDPDKECGCRRGWVEDDQGQTVTCRVCALGKWFTAGGRL
jgi:hypothetical protein